MPAVAGGTRAPQPQEQNYTQPPEPTQPQRAAFPHAFERWETLSSHWEGLTSYWIRKLQENTNELDGKPIDKQMARQITDLSAAGANLFHAVVELQRLRASSERKFQRWFFDQKTSQEQQEEQIGQLQEQLRQERARRPEVASSASMGKLREEKTKAEEKLREMHRELAISKEEARRAWEELGRREQEERERTRTVTWADPEGQARVREWFLPRAAAKGYPEEIVEQIWNILVSFASFGFCKAHAAAFALPTYQSAWLKRHYPAHFLAGILTHDPGMYPKRRLLEEARRMNIAVLGLDVNRSTGQYRAERLDGAEEGMALPEHLAIGAPPTSKQADRRG